MDRPITARPRVRRFTLPEHDDARVHRVVEGLLSSPVPDHPDRGRARPASDDPFLGLVPRLEWTAALEHEERRRARYARPAAVVAVELGASHDPERTARLAARLLRRTSRDTDRIARVGPRRFHVLLPETAERGARRYADRLEAAWAAARPELGGPVAMTIAAAGTRQDEPLTATLARAVGQLP